MSGVAPADLRLFTELVMASSRTTEHQLGTQVHVLSGTNSHTVLLPIKTGCGHATRHGRLSTIMTAPAVRRPGLVTLLVVLIVIGGIVAVLAGIMAVIATGVIGGIIFIVVGLIYFAVAKGLSDGNGLSRIIVAVVSAVQLVLAIFTIISTDDSNTRSSAIASGIFAVVILAILYSPTANRFFSTN